LRDSSKSSRQFFIIALVAHGHHQLELHGMVVVVMEAAIGVFHHVDPLGPRPACRDGGRGGYLDRRWRHTR
jgi:hypothetical protein